MVQRGHRRTNGFHALARPPRLFKFLDCLIDTDPYSVYNLLSVLFVPPMSWSMVTAVIGEKEQTLGEDSTVEIRPGAGL